MRSHFLISILGVAICLVLVGWVSHTPIRHLIQASPLIIVSGLMIGTTDKGLEVGAPMLAFWLFIVALIWLHLLGVRSPIDGTFSVSEIALTVGIGIFAVLGLTVVIAARLRFRSLRSVVIAGIALVFQVVAMWISLLPGVATR